MVSQTAPPPPLPHAAFALATALEMEAKRRASSPHKVHQSTNASGRAVRRPRYVRDPFGSAIDPLAGALGLIWDSDRDPASRLVTAAHSTGAMCSSGDGEVSSGRFTRALGPLDCRPTHLKASQARWVPGSLPAWKTLPSQTVAHAWAPKETPPSPSPPCAGLRVNDAANQGDMTMTEEAVAAMERDRPPAVAEGFCSDQTASSGPSNGAGGGGGGHRNPSGSAAPSSSAGKGGGGRLYGGGTAAGRLQYRFQSRAAGSNAGSCHPHPVRPSAQLRPLNRPGR